MGYLFRLAVLMSKIVTPLKKLNMKNAFKFGFLALAVTLSVAACKGSGSTTAADSLKKADSIAKADSAAKAMTADSTKKDSTVVDSAKKDSTKKM